MPRRLDVVLLAVLVAAGVAARWAWWSGIGLGDDILLRWDVRRVVVDHAVNASPNAYRFTWWLPTALVCSLLGVTDRGLVLPILLFDALGIAAAYLLGLRLFGRAGAVFATLLLLVHPLDFAWSTRLTTDIVFSTVTAFAILAELYALDAASPAARRRWWCVAAVLLWLAFHAKVTGVFVGLVMVLIAAWHRARVDRSALAFVATAALCFGGTAVVSWWLTGDPLAPVSSEIRYQGLAQPDAVRLHALTPDVWWSFPRWLFVGDQLGDHPNAWYAPALVVLALVAPWLGLRTSVEAAVWLAVLFLGMQLNLQRMDGVWVAGFRNIRHGHPFTHPLVLLLAGYLAALWARRRWLAVVVLALLVVPAAWQSVRVAERTTTPFAQLHELAATIAALPPGPVLSDFQLVVHFAMAELGEHGHPLRELHLLDAAKRRAQIAAPDASYLVTGGAREPYYGCIDCIPRADERDPAAWRLVREWPMPADPPRWWPEPMRLWEHVPAPAAVDPRGNIR